MQAVVEWAPTVALVLFVAFFIWIAIAAMRKARRRRHEELREGPLEEQEERQEPARLKGRAAAPPATTKPPTPEPEAAAAAAEPEPSGAGAGAVKAEPTRAAEPEPTRAPEPEPKEEAPKREPDAALTRGLAKTSSSLRERLTSIWRRHPKLDPSIIEELEVALLTSDVGVGMTTRLMSSLRDDIKASRFASSDEVQRALREHLMVALRNGSATGDPFLPAPPKPRVILFVGVNGVGKTTTIGKVAAHARARGLAVVLAAGDTFRAAAVEQLEIWGKRTGAHVVRSETGADPASVIFNGIREAAKSHADLILADTAGRLHTKTQLMDEIKKVKRSAGKARDGAPDEIWLVVDATTGQNALQQAREFHQALGLTGVILTKLDGTAKGGVVIAIADALHLPVRFVGVGEEPEDLRPFEAEAFIGAMFS